MIYRSAYIICASILLIGLSASNHTFAQSNYADSLRKRVNIADIHTSDRVDELIKLSLELVYVQPKEALVYGQRALELAQELQYERGIASSYRTLGSIYSAQDNYITSSDYLQRALSTFEAVNDSVGIANCYISLGHTFRRQNNRENEVYYHRLSYEYFSKLDIDERLGVAAHNLGESFLNIGKIDSALLLTQQAIKINLRVNRLSVLSSCFKALGKIYIKKNEINEAEKAFKEVIRISEQLGDNAQKIALIESLIQLSDIKAQQKKPQEQIRYLLTANELNSAYNFFELTGDLFDRIVKYYLQEGDITQARRYLQRSVVVLDSINVKQQEDRSELMMTAIKSYQLEKEASVLERENELQNELIRQQKIQIALGFALLLLLSIAIFGFYRINKKLSISNMQLERDQVLIQDQKERLEELNATKDKFFGIIAHDLRGPLGTVKQLMDFYFSEDLDLPKEEKLKVAQLIKKSVNNTYDLLVNLINWSSIQMQKEEAVSELFSLREIVERIISIYQQTATEKSIEMLIQIDENIHAYADPNQVELIIRNLVNNALKFTQEGGMIAVKAIIDLSHKMVCIQVVDNGTGIPKEMQSKIFDITTSTRSRKGTNGEAGSGLGLILCKEYAEMNKGTLDFESFENKGTTFTLCLPQKPKA